MLNRVSECKKEGVTYIGVPSGSLQHHTVQLLIDAGYLLEHPGKKYEIVCAENKQIVFRIIDRIDMARRIVQGVVDAGFTPEDYRRETGIEDDDVEVITDFIYAKQTREKSRLVLASRPELITSIDQCRGASIGTELLNLTQAMLMQQHGFNEDDLTRIEKSNGKTETLVPFGVADVITDVSETGSALRANGMSVIGEPLFRSSPQFVANKETLDEHSEVFKELIARFRSVLAKEVVPMTMLSMNVPLSLKEAIIALLPKEEAVDVIPTEDPNIIKLQSLVPQLGVQNLMYQLVNAGANFAYEDFGKREMTKEMIPDL